LPASPARAASIVAFSASRLVCPAMVLIRPTTSPIFCAPSASVLTMLSVRLASCTARSAISDDCATWRAISEIDADNCSAADATVCTLTLAASTAAVTLVACAVVSPVVAAIAPAVASSSVAAEATTPTRPAVRSSNSRSRASSRLARCCFSVISAS
jgi:hypothetical protein